MATNLKQEKGFWKKTIVTFTNSTVFILDFFIYIYIMQTSNTDSLVLCFGLNGDQHAWNLMKEH